MITDQQVEAACEAFGIAALHAPNVETAMRAALEAAAQAAPAPHTTDKLPLPATPDDVLKRLRLARKTLIWVQNNCVNKGDLGKIVTTHCRHVLDEIGWRHERVDKS